MDQVKVFLRQCVKHRFWIAVGISMLLPMIGYFLGIGPIVEATTKAEGEIKNADTEVKKYNSPGLPNSQYPPIVKEKTELLTKDVDATWQKLFEQQEPLLRWPAVVEPQFRAWGKKWPENVDRGVVTQAIVDYTIAYPDFVTKLYKSFTPWDPLEGTGIVAAPEEQILIRPAAFDPAVPPELGKVWAEQERLWVVTALLDVVRKVNDSVGAKDWDGAIIKQINGIEVGTQLAQDQVSIARGETLEPAQDLFPEGQEPAAAPTADASMDPTMMGMMSPNPNAQAGLVLYIKTDSTQYTSLPIMMSVLVDQAHLQDFLIGLENSPISIQVKEPEISKPMKPVEKPVYGMNMNFGYGMGGYGMGMGMDGAMMPGGYGMGMNMGMGRGMAMPGEGMLGMGMGMGMNPAAKQGKSVRDIDKKALREKAAKEAKAKPVVKAKALDPYYNVIEVTVYGQARFYNAPPPPAPAESSSTPPADGATSPDPAAPAPAADPATPAPADPAAAQPDGAAPASAPAPTPAPAPPQS
ncbi:hypothetical protein TA3x_004621 [Tundrisphaera sp. TA3]|uniref:hypothetical protein n=1 Tax=Tundrisphaera sp. TA3 TaxID=3435775 RepID=UPI003EB8D2E6